MINNVKMKILKGFICHTYVINLLTNFQISINFCKVDGECKDNEIRL